MSVKADGTRVIETRTGKVVETWDTNEKAKAAAHIINQKNKKRLQKILGLTQGRGK